MFVRPTFSLSVRLRSNVALIEQHCTVIMCWTGNFLVYDNIVFTESVFAEPRLMVARYLTGWSDD